MTKRGENSNTRWDGKKSRSSFLEHRTFQWLGFRKICTVNSVMLWRKLTHASAHIQKVQDCRAPVQCAKKTNETNTFQATDLTQTLRDMAGAQFTAIRTLLSFDMHELSHLCSCSQMFLDPRSHLRNVPHQASDWQVQGLSSTCSHQSAPSDSWPPQEKLARYGFRVTETPVGSRASTVCNQE